MGSSQGAGLGSRGVRMVSVPLPSISVLTGHVEIPTATSRGSREEPGHYQVYSLLRIPRDKGHPLGFCGGTDWLPCSALTCTDAPFYPPV